jgi:hypothetical protein
LTDNILLSAIEKIATSYHTQPNFLPKQKNISESKDLYIIEFSIPWNRPVLGGGYGFYHIDKHTMQY